MPDDLQAKFFKDFTKEIEEFSKRLDEFVPDEVADDYVKFIKENKEEILKSEDKFKALVGDFDGLQCVLTTLLKLGPRFSDSDVLSKYTVEQALDLWTKYLSGEV